MSSFIRDAMDWIRERAVEGSKPTIVQMPAMRPGQVYMVARPGGEGDLETVEPAPRRYVALTLEGLVEQVKAFGGTSVGKLGSTKVFVGGGTVLAVFDEEAARETVTLELEPCVPFDRLDDEDHPEGALLEARPQRDLLATIKRDLDNRIDPPTFVPSMKQLRWRTSSDGSSNVSVGKESMGRQINASVAVGNGAGGEGEAAIDEEVTVTAPVYLGLAEFDDALEKAVTARVRCAVNVDFQNERISVMPITGEMEKARIAADRGIVAYLREQLGKDVTVLSGSGVGKTDFGV